jgi:hypothetical protein
MGKKIRVWDGTAWQDVSPSLPYTAIHSAQASMPATGVDGQVWLDTDGTLAGQDFVPLSGGTMTGNLNTPSINSGGITGRNYLINGGFDFWQRGTTWSGSGYSAADRWYVSIAGTTTMTREDSDLPSNSQFKYGVRITTGDSASYGQLYQALEEMIVRNIRGKTVTVSGYVKVSGNYSGSQYLNVDFNTSTDALLSQSTNTSSTPIGNAVDAANWKYFSVSFVIPTNAYGLRLGFIPDQAQPSGSIVRYTGLKMELGSQATPFNRAGGTIAGELAACQRYYYKTYNIDVTPGTVTDPGYLVCDIPSFRITRHGFRLPVTMRTTPSVAVYNPATGGAGTIRTNAATNFTLNGPFAIGTSGGFFDFNPSSGEYGVYHLVAQAEL